MKIIKDKTSLEELQQMAKKTFGNLVKAVVDVERGIMAVDGELHADEESALLASGSKQKNLWGINIYPELSVKDFIEFDSMINVRPSVGNISPSIESKKIRHEITGIVNKLVKR